MLKVTTEPAEGYEDMLWQITSGYRVWRSRHQGLSLPFKSGWWGQRSAPTELELECEVETEDQARRVALALFSVPSTWKVQIDRVEERQLVRSDSIQNLQQQG